MVYPGSQNITSLDIFGIHVASFGCPESESSRHDDIEIIEKSSDRKYHRLIIGGGRLIGAQFVGDARDMGALLSLVVRKDNLKEIGQAPGSSLNFWYRRAARYIAPVAGSPSK